MEKKPVCLFVKCTEEDEVLQSSTTEHRTEKQVVKIFFGNRQNLQKTQQPEESHIGRILAALHGRKPSQTEPAESVLDKFWQLVSSCYCDLECGEVFLPPEVRLHPGAECGAEVVEVHQCVDS